MYNNETAGPALEEFLQLLGDKVRLKGFTKYRAQLDTKSKNQQQPTFFLEHTCTHTHTFIIDPGCHQTHYCHIQYLIADAKMSCRLTGLSSFNSLILSRIHTLLFYFAFCQILNDSDGKSLSGFACVALSLFFSSLLLISVSSQYSPLCMCVCACVRERGTHSRADIALLLGDFYMKVGRFTTNKHQIVIEIVRPCYGK